MRGVCALVLVSLLSGCATTVHRLDGEFPTPVGHAKSDCEKRDWLVVSPTRAAFVDKYGIKSETRDDGVALYRVGDSAPVSIPSLSDELGDAPRTQRHADAVRSHDTKQLVAAGMGVASLVAFTVGTVLFINGFGTERTASGKEQQKLDGTRLALGGIGVGLGFGFGIAGLSVNPGQAERSRAEASRFVFLPPEDPKQDVLALAGRHNQAVRDRCDGRVRP